MIKEVYQKCIKNGVTPSQLSRDEFMALIVFKHWAEYIDPQNMCYYMMCTLDNDPDTADESRLDCIIHKANKYAEKYCHSMYTYSEDEDKELVFTCTEEFENFYLMDWPNEREKLCEKVDDENI